MQNRNNVDETIYETIVNAQNPGSIVAESFTDRPNPFYRKPASESYETLVADSPKSFTYLADGEGDYPYLEPNDYSKIVILSTDDFTWKPEGRCFIDDICDFDEFCTDFFKGGAGDQSYLYLQNPATGKTILFFLLESETYAEELPDFKGLVFAPTAEEYLRNPKLGGVQIRFVPISPEMEDMHMMTHWDS